MKSKHLVIIIFWGGIVITRIDNMTEIKTLLQLL